VANAVLGFDLTDRAKLLLIAIMSRAWREPYCTSSHSDLAKRLGWWTKGDRPAISKVKEAIWELEEKGYVQRILTCRKGVHKRHRIELLSKARWLAPSQNPGNLAHVETPSAPVEISTGPVEISTTPVEISTTKNTQSEEDPRKKTHSLVGAGAPTTLSNSAAGGPDSTSKRSDPETEAARDAIVRQVQDLVCMPKGRPRATAIFRIAIKMADLLVDDQSVGRYRKLLGQVVKGEIPVAIVLEAFHDVLASDTADVPGACFFGSVAKRLEEAAKDELMAQPGIRCYPSGESRPIASKPKRREPQTEKPAEQRTAEPTAPAPVPDPATARTPQRRRKHAPAERRGRAEAQHARRLGSVTTALQALVRMPSGTPREDKKRAIEVTAKRLSKLLKVERDNDVLAVARLVARGDCGPLDVLAALEERPRSGRALLDAVQHRLDAQKIRRLSQTISANGAAD
jgi:hypothetical protein